MNPKRNSWGRRWKKFRAHTPAQRALILRAAGHWFLSLAGLRLMGFRRCKDLIARFSLVPKRSNSSAEQILNSVRAMQSVERNLPFPPNCLERSLALWWMLRREGFPAELHIGARKSGQRFEAHAWVESQGRALNDSSAVHEHYARFDTPLASADWADSL